MTWSSDKVIKEIGKWEIAVTTILCHTCPLHVAPVLDVHSMYILLLGQVTIYILYNKAGDTEDDKPVQPVVTSKTESLRQQLGTFVTHLGQSGKALLFLPHKFGSNITMVSNLSLPNAIQIVPKTSFHTLV